MRSLFTAFKTLVPLLTFAFVAAAGLALVPESPLSALSDSEWQGLVLLASPLSAWAFIALLDALEILEFDAKAGRTNFVISWILLGAAYWPETAFIDPDSVALPVMLTINVIVTVAKLIAWRLPPGAFRETIDREVSLARHGTTWRPAKILDHGSAKLADVRKAAKFYKSGSIIFGTARRHLPEADGFLAGLVRRLLNLRALPFAMKEFTLTVLRPGKAGSLKAAIKAAKAAYGADDAHQMMKADVNGHILVVSGSGGGKTVSFVIPNALSYNAGSFICIDPKSEVHAVTAAARKKMGHDTFILKPGDFDTDSTNVIGWLNPHGQTFTRDCMTIASWLFASDGGGDDGASYYNETAKRLFAFVVAYLVADWGRKRDEQLPFPTLTDVYNYLFRSPAEISKDIETLYGLLQNENNANIFGQPTAQIRTWAATFVGGDVERTWPNTISSVQKNFWWIGDPSISSVVCGTPREGSAGSRFEAMDLLNGKTSVYICIPLAVLEATPGLARLIVGAFLNAIFAAEGRINGSTLFMVDEMQVLGDFPILHQTALNQGRGYGITLAGIIQAPEALDKQAGEKTYDAWVDNCMLSQYFAIGGADTAEKISAQIGETTVESTNYSGGVNKQRGQVLGADNGGVQISKARHSRRLKTASEIIDLPREYAVVFRRVGVSDPKVGKLPMVVGTCYYKNQPDLMAVASDNPFERKAYAEDFSPQEPLPDSHQITDLSVQMEAEEAEPVLANLGEWKDYDPRETLKKMAEQNSEAAMTIAVLEALENGEELSDDQESVLDALLRQPQASVPAGAFDDLSMAEFTFGEDEDDGDALQQLISESEKITMVISEQKSIALAVAAQRQMISDDQPFSEQDDVAFDLDDLDELPEDGDDDGDQGDHDDDHEADDQHGDDGGHDDQQDDEDIYAEMDDLQTLMGEEVEEADEEVAMR